MKYSDIAEKTKTELESLLSELRSQLEQLSFDSGDKKLKDVSQFGKIRRDIARIHTVLRNRTE